MDCHGRFHDLSTKSQYQSIGRSESPPDELVETVSLDGNEAAVPRVWGQLQLLEQLGAGGQGTVYKALETHLDTEVALKLVPRSDLQSPNRFEEARQLAKVRHGNVVTVFGVDDHSGFVGMWMELIRGGTLEDLLRTTGPMSASEAAVLGIDLCRALAAVHGAGLVHGDVKTTNVMREVGGRIVLMDFGLASPARASSTAQPRTGPRGTPMYMSPEMFRGAPATTLTDVYAVGVILYRMLAANYPVHATSLSDLIELHHRRAGKRLLDVRPNLPGAIAAVVETALSPDPEQRPQTCGEFADALAGFLDGNEEGTGRRRGEPRIVLPTYASSFVGRVAEQRTVIESLKTYQVVSLIGPGGSGKTRLAVESARTLADTPDVQSVHHDGIAFIDLTSATGPDSILDAFHMALEIPEGNGHRRQRLAERLRGKRRLLLLDNCENVCGFAGELLEDLCAKCPDLKVLTTTRERLGIPLEKVILLAPLSMTALTDIEARPILGSSEPSDGQPVDESIESDAVRLFLDRARAACPAFVVDSSSLGSVRKICSELDGIPLALELAAARMRVLDPVSLLDRLTDRFQILKSRSAGGPHRHRTLYASIDWSYSQLDASEQVMFRRLSVFRGGWTLAAAESICSDLPADESKKDAKIRVEDFEVLDHLTSLLDKSLILLRPWLADRSPRFGMLETLREFASTQLEAPGTDSLELEARYRAFFLKVVERAKDVGGRSEAARVFVEIDDDIENIRCAMQSCVRSGSREMALRFTGVLGPYWVSRGFWSEAEEWFQRLLEGEIPRDHHGARLLASAALLARWKGDRARSASLVREEVGIRELLGNELGVANALNRLVLVLDDEEEVKALLERALSIQRRLADQSGAGASLQQLAEIEIAQGRLLEAKALLEESLRLSETSGDIAGMSLRLNGLGIVAGELGSFDEGRVHHRRALEILERVRHKAGIAQTLTNLSGLELKAGDLSAARAHVSKALELQRKIGDSRGAAQSLQIVAQIAIAEGDLMWGARMLGAASNLDLRLPSPQEVLSKTAVLADAADLQEQVEDGSTLSFEETVEEARCFLRF